MSRGSICSEVSCLNLDRCFRNEVKRLRFAHTLVLAILLSLSRFLFFLM